MDFKINGAGGRNRTDTRLPSQDFESCASTNFTTPAHLFYNDLQVFWDSIQRRYYNFYYNLL